MDNKSYIGALWRCVLVVVLFSLLPGCSPRIIEKVKTEYVYQTSHQVDTTWLKDSVYIKEWVKGDTIRIVEYRDHLVYQYKMVRDTVIQRDSVAVENIKEVKVEKPLSWWQKARIRAFWWLLGCLILCFAWIFRKPLIRILK